MQKLVLTFIPKLIFVFIVLPASAQTIKMADYLRIPQYGDWRMHAYNFPQTPGGDSVFAEPYNEIWYYNLDSLCYWIAKEKKSVAELQDLMQHYYYQVMDYIPLEKRLIEWKRMREAARFYRSGQLKDEADYMEILTGIYPLDTTVTGFDEKNEKIHNLINRAAKKGDKARECTLLFEAFQMYRSHGNYAKAFKYCPGLIEKLGQLTDTEFPFRRVIYYYIGALYYDFKDYEKAFSCLEKVIREKVILFTDRWNLAARKLMAEYYASLNRLDLSDSYYLSIYNNKDIVRFRISFDIGAVVGIAANMIKRKQYDDALRILERWLPEAYKEQSLNNITQIYINMGWCFLESQQLKRTKAAIDSAKITIAKRQGLEPYYEDLYELTAKYYEALGDIELEQQYRDSAKYIAQKQLDERNALIILRAEQELFESEKMLKDKKITFQRRSLQCILIALIVVMLVLIMLVHLYKKKKTAYQILVQKSKLWANNKKFSSYPSDLDSETNSTVDENEEFLELENKSTIDETESKLIMEQIYNFMDSQKPFKDPDFSISTMSEQLKVPKNKLSAVGNQIVNCNFKTFVNNYRIREAIQMMSNVEFKKCSIDEIAFASGFNDRTTFYRSFKKMTGLSPTEFRRNNPKK